MLAEFTLVTTEDSSPSTHTDAEFALASEIELALETGYCQCYEPIKTRCKKVRNAVISGDREAIASAIYRGR